MNFVREKSYEKHKLIFWELLAQIYLPEQVGTGRLVKEFLLIFHYLSFFQKYTRETFIYSHP